LDGLAASYKTAMPNQSVWQEKAEIERERGLWWRRHHPRPAGEYRSVKSEAAE